jgi:hypothetical protein
LSSNAIELPKGTLAELTDHLKALWDTVEMIDDPEVLREAEAEAWLYLQAEVRKVDNVSDYIARCENEAGWLKAESMRLRQRAEMWENRGDRLRDYVKRVMQEAGILRLEGRASSFYLRAATPSVIFTNEALIPDEFKEQRITIAVDKRAIREAIEAGQDVPGADLALGGQTLVRR